MRYIKKNTNKKSKIAGIIIAVATLSACNTDFENPIGDSEDYSRGSADFSKFVSIGDSLTAGYADGALYKSGQESSFPNILAQQFSEVGGGSFTQPLMNDDLGGLLFLGAENPDFPTRLILNVEPKSIDDPTPKGPESIAGTPSTDAFVNLGAIYNNMGVPGAKSYHLAAPGYGNPAGLGTSANPYFTRFASSTTASVIADAAAQEPTFFTFWVGNNDVLSYATAGGDGVDRTGDDNVAGYGSDDITDPTYFAGVYTSLLNAITTASPSAKGILLNIPDISTLPFFTTVPYNPIVFTSSAEDQAKIDGLTAYYSAHNAAIDGSTLTDAEKAKRTITFKVGQNPVVIFDETLPDITGIDPMRQATADDLLVLKSSSIINTPDPDNTALALGVTSPLEDKYVLISSEITEIKAATDAYNATIKAAADADSDLLFLDVNAIMNELSSTGINYGTGTITATYAKGDGFSLDGVHPTARAYAVIANRIIAEINQGFDANIPPVNPADYTTIFIK